MKTLLVLIVVLYASTVDAQTVLSQYRVSVDDTLRFKGLGGGPAEIVPLKWSRPTGDTLNHPVLGIGYPVLREANVLLGSSRSPTTVTYTDTLRSPARVVARVTEPARVVPGRRATIYVDSKVPSRLHVNFWNPKDTLRWEQDGQEQSLSPRQLREVDYYFDLENRQTVRFPYYGVAKGATTIPFRYRPGYDADNGARVGSDLSASVNASVYYGFATGVVEYFYQENATNALRRRENVILAPFIGLSLVTFDSTSTLSAATPLSSSETAFAISPGIALMTNYSDVEFGLFVGADYGIGSAAQKWDYNRRIWIGFGLGFKALKLFG